MNRVIPFIIAGSMISITPSCDVLTEMSSTMQTNLPLTEAEVSSGLREALKVGIKNAVTQTSAENGYYGNSLIKIPFPPEAQRVKSTLTDLGMNSLVDRFEESMNHAAEQASAKATDIFVDAITQMTINDAMGILNGENDAATQYLKRTTGERLRGEFSPIIQSALESVKVTQYWDDITTQYNKIPFVTPVNTDLTDYVTRQAIDGLYLMVAAEERKIRENPEARVTELLKRVFGSSQS